MKIFKEPKKEGYIIKENKAENTQSVEAVVSVSASIKENEEHVKHILSVPLSEDIVIRSFKISIGGEERSAFIFFIDGLVDSDSISHFVLNPLMHDTAYVEKCGSEAEYVSSKLISQNVLTLCENMGDSVERVCFGECGLFIDKIDICFLTDVKSWEKRGVSSPATEGSVLGPQESFTELIRTNTAMLRKTVKDPNLIIERASVGKKSKTPCGIVYIKSLANPTLVKEVRERISKINADYVFSSEELENFLEDKNFCLMPQILATERPDRAAMEIADGNVIVLVNGSPFALVMPATFFTFMKTTDNSYMRLPYANLLSVVRYLAMLVSLFLPALFVVMTDFHHEMIPTDLLYALEASFEKTPFPTVFELVILEIAFELIREAVIKFPSIGGPSIGIVGALVLGQAAVSASIVSPIIIIIVATTAIGSLSTPNYSFGLSFRIMKFVYIIFASIAGFVGFSVCLFMHMATLVSIKSFGVRYFSPAAPKTRESFFKTLFVTKDYKKTSKPDYINTKGDKDE